MFSLNIKNYRSFKDQSFDFSKMNILIGENSSGKSSLIKFFLALKQTFETPSTSKESNLSLTGEYADLGNYKEMIYYHDNSLPLIFDFKFDGYDDFFEFFIYASEEEDNKDRGEALINKIKILINPDPYSNNQLKFELSSELDRHYSIKTTFSSSQYGDLEIIHSKPKSNQLTSLFGNTCDIKFYYRLTDETITLTNLTYEKEGFLSLINPVSLQNSIVRYYDKTLKDYENDLVEGDFKNQVDKIYYTIAYMLVYQNYLRYYIGKIEYINPLKAAPQRIYYNKDDKQAQHINDIEDFVNFFSRKNPASDIILPHFIQILKDFGIINDLEILSDERLPVKELRVKIKDLLSNISDVGYGVSLQLPIILKCFLAEVIPERHGSIIFIEQPEVHLHPKLHAKLIETLFNLSKHTSYFIETHSEHIIRKMQVLVKEKRNELQPDDVTIHYLVREERHSKVTVHNIKLDGKLDPVFASGFFDNSYILSKALLD